MQLALCTNYPKTKAAARWAVPGTNGGAVVMLNLEPHPGEVPAELLKNGLKLVATETLATMNGHGCLAMKLTGPQGAVAQLLAELPRPKSKGSYTESNCTRLR